MSGFPDADGRPSATRSEESYESWKQEMGQHMLQFDSLQAKIVELKASIEVSKPAANKELEALRRRVMAAATLLKHLKSKARIMAPDSSHVSCGVGKSLDHSRTLDSENCNDSHHASTDGQEEACVGEMITSVKTISDAMDFLVNRVIICESEATIEKEKAKLGQEEIRRKSMQLESMSLKLDEMEQFALGTNAVLTEMRQRVEDLVEETSRQRQRAAENDQELSRVKRDFESLKSYVNWLVNIRESPLSSEKQLQTIEKLFERLLNRTTQLEGEKMQKEAEVRKLMQENVRLTTLLDKKEAQLAALNEQCKAMALVTASM